MAALMRARWSGATSRSLVALVRRDQPFAGGLLPAFQRPLRKQRGDARAGCRVGVLIDGHIDATGARLFHQLERLHALPPIGLADHLVVRDLRRQPALLADANGLAPQDD